MDSPASTFALSEADRQFVVDFRRDLHRHPELAFEEHRTAGRVADVLGEAGLEVRPGVARTGVLGVLRGAASAGRGGHAERSEASGSPPADRGPTRGSLAPLGMTGRAAGAQRETGKTILIRADMDALPVQEAPGRPYGSQEQGKMHACGHDGHTAMALTAARVLARGRERLPGNVVFAFQPAEETTGGAARMIQEGALRDPQVHAAIGFHLANTLPVGQIAAQPGPITAATDGFALTITGKGGHAARPHLSVDPVAVSFQVGTALHTLMTRERSPAQPAVLTIGAIHGGTAGNVIADSVELRGTLRTYDPQLREHLRRRVEEVVTGIAVALRAGARLEWDEGAYPPCVNSPEITALMQRATVAVLGERALVEHEPSLGGDDMAFFLAAVPGCYARLGSANAAAGLDAPHHSARFDFDEGALPIGVEVLVRATLDFLST